MTTDRTQTVRPPALPNRSVAPAEQPAARGFAQLLDAHAATRRNGEAAARRDDRQPRDDRTARNDAQPPTREPRRDENLSPREAARRDLIAAGAPVVEQELHSAPETPFVAQIAPALPTGEPVTAPVITPALLAQPLLTPELPAAAQTVAPVPTPAPQAPAAEAPVVAAPAQPAAQLPVATAPATTTPATTTPAQVLADTAARAAATGAPQAEAAPAETPAQAAGSQAPAPGVPAEQPQTAEVPQAATPAEEPSAPATPAAPAAASTTAQAKAEPQTAAPATPSTPVTAAPDVQTPTPLSGQVGPQRSVALHRAPAAVATLLHVAAERGITHAKMALKPAELGGIEIRLQSTPAGIAAQVVADSPEAARLLAQAGDDLRRALEARDVNLVSLEVSTSSDQQRESARGEWSDGDGDDAGRFGSSSRSTGGADGDAEPAPTTHSVIELPGGLLVDVLA
jgi:flagellar hook-length control protein FliK